jgi:ketosteroid isomerase-like protein
VNGGNDGAMDHRWQPAPAGSTGYTAAAIDHARLSYEYLDAGEIDAYGSLFAEDVVLRWPGRPALRGRPALERFRADQTRSCRHAVTNVFGAGRNVAAQGRLTIGPHAGRPVLEIEFVDIYTVSDDGLFVAQQTYLFLPPPDPGT